MTNEDAIVCLKGIKNYGRDTFTEQSDWQTSLEMAIKALEQESCEDAISRQVAINSIWDGTNMDIYTSEVKESLEALPPVTPKPKTGHWKYRDLGNARHLYCSECKLASLTEYDFCPNCGAKMIELQESEEV